MNKMIKIRNEEETDYQRVEDITRKSFWNVELFSSTIKAGRVSCEGT